MKNKLVIFLVALAFSTLLYAVVQKFLENLTGLF